MGITELTRGQRVRLADLSPSRDLLLDLRLDGPDPAKLRSLALCLDRAGRILGGDEVIFHGRRSSRCGGVTFRPEEQAPHHFGLELDRLDRAIERIVLAIGLVGGAGAPEASTIRRGEVTLRLGGQPAARYPFLGTDFSGERAICLVELYRKDPWRLAVTASGFRGGLAPLLSNYGAPPNFCRMVEAAPGTLLEREPTGQVNAGIRLPTSWPGRQQPPLPRGLQPAVGLIIVKTASGEVHSGTGFAITPGGHVLTCAHVVEDAVESHIAFGGSRRLRQLVPVAGDRPTDCAVLWLSDREGCGDWALLAEPSHEPGLGDPLGILGYPLGLDLGLEVSYCEGIVNSVRTMESGRVLQIDAGAAPGSSGAPVFSRQTGRILGLLKGGLQAAGMHVNFAVDIRTVWGHGWFSQEG